MKILYIDAVGGASGDMLAGAMLDLGWPIAELEQLIQQMGLEDQVRVSVDFPVHHSIRTSRLQVTLLANEEHHSQFDQYQHEHKHECGQGKCGSHDHADVEHIHAHMHGKKHEHNHGPHHKRDDKSLSHQHHRGLNQVLELLQKLPQNIGQPAGKVFQRLAGAEAAVHGVAIEDIHFHEVGALDAIVDVVAFCAALAWLRPKRIVCSPLPLGRGFVDCAHGRLPLPAPAVLNLLQDVPVHAWPEEGETVTPTGAALLTTLVDEFAAMPSFKLLKTGTGGGSRSTKARPNVLRAMLGEGGGQSSIYQYDEVIELQCNIDDQLGEDYPFISEQLMRSGALDVAASPLLMKKGRPGLQLSVLCAAQKADEMAGILLEQSTSLGVRMQLKRRYLLPRQMRSLNTPWGEVRIKSVILQNNETRNHIEAEDVLAISRQTGMSPAQVREKIYKLVD